MLKLLEFKDYKDQEVVDFIVREFSVERESVNQYEVIACSFDIDGYEEYVYLLLKKDHEFYEVNAGHCSCYGFEEQFEPKLSSLKYILSDNYSKDKEIQKYVKERFCN